MEMSDSQCEETLTDFFNKWESADWKISSGKKATSDNYDDLVHNIGANLREIKKSIHLLTQWKKDVAKVFKGLQPSVSQLIERLEKSNNDGEDPSVTQSNEGPEMAINKGDAIYELKHIKQNVHEIKNGTGQIMKLPRVELKEKPIKRLTISWKTTMLEETIMGSPAMAMARSTYDGLEDQLKLCFLSLSIFPENSIIRKRSLVYWWIGEGFVAAEEEAEKCFEKLFKSGLVEAVEEQFRGSPRSCRLYPLIRWMAIEIAKETMFFDFDSDGKPLSGPSHCTRRAFVAGTSGGGEEVAELRSEKFNLKPEPSKLESLFNLDVNCIELDEEDFRKLNKVKTLQLGRWITAPVHHIELLNPVFLNHLKQLKKLRYLSLQGISRITELADIQQLSELRVLDLRACHNLEKLPEEIAKLKKLTHLDVSECYLLEHMPKGVGYLSELRLLNGFVVNRSKKACQVSELTKLGNLEKLSISLGTKAMVTDGVLNPIGEIESLKSLRITWGSTPTEKENADRTANDTPTQSLRFRELCLPPLLTKLELECYPEEEPPLFKRKPDLQGDPEKKPPLFKRRSDLQGDPEKKPPLFKRKSDLQGDPEKKPPLDKLYFRGGNLKSLKGLRINGDQKCEVKFIRLRFLKDLVMEMKDFEEEFPSLQIMQPHECPHIKYSLELVSRGGIPSPQWKDEASTSTNPST